MPADSSSPLGPALDRLRRHVAAAAREIERLRAENERLAARVDELEASPAAGLDGTVVAFDADREALRAQVERSLAAVDHYLAQDKISS